MVAGVVTSEAKRPADFILFTTAERIRSWRAFQFDLYVAWMKEGPWRYGRQT